MSSSKAPTSPQYLITPEDFQKLHPVHYRIFDFLKPKIPVTLIQTCREFYEELIPGIYERIIINGRNYHSITGGASITLQENDCGCHECGRCEDLSRTIGETDRWGFDSPDIKTKALNCTKFVSFADSTAVCQFTSYSRYCEWEHIHNCCERQFYLLDKPIFPDLEHIHLDKEVVQEQVINFLSEPGVDLRCHRNDELLEIIFENRAPHTICIDWPEGWTSEDPEEYVMDEDQWDLESGMEDFLLEIAQYECVKHIIIHLDYTNLTDVTSSLNKITENADLTFYMKKPSKRVKLFSLLDCCWNHFQQLSKEWKIDELPISYSVFPTKGIKKVLKTFEELIEKNHMKLFTKFSETIEIRKKGCACKDKSSK